MLSLGWDSQDAGRRAHGVPVLDHASSNRACSRDGKGERAEASSPLSAERLYYERCRRNATHHVLADPCSPEVRASVPYPAVWEGVLTSSSPPNSMTASATKSPAQSLQPPIQSPAQGANEGDCQPDGLVLCLICLCCWRTEERDRSRD